MKLIIFSKSSYGFFSKINLKLICTIKYGCVFEIQGLLFLRKITPFTSSMALPLRKPGKCFVLSHYLVFIALDCENSLCQ